MSTPASAGSQNFIGQSLSAASQCTAPLSVDAAPEDWPAAVPALARELGASIASAASAGSAGASSDANVTAQGALTLADLTALRLGGPVREYREVATEAEFVDAIREADESGTPLLVIGGGSNIVASDAGFDGLVLRDARQDVRLTADDRCGGVEILATAGVTWDDLVRQAIASEWGGFEALSGIPGTVGAAPVQNIGAYGAEVAELIASVRAYDRLTGQSVYMPLSKLGLTYRSSILKKSLTDPEIGGGRTWGPTGRWVILSVTFSVRAASLSSPVAYKQLADKLGVELGARVPARDLREAVLELRRSKGMILDPADPDTTSAGSYFTNPMISEEQAAHLPVDAPRYPVTDHTRIVPGTQSAPVIEGVVKTSAAWLIEHAGFSKGFSLSDAERPASSAASVGTGSAGEGSAGVSLSTKHTLALTNRGGGTSEELIALQDHIVEGVRDAFGITLVPEPVHVGF